MRSPLLGEWFQTSHRHWQQDVELTVQMLPEQHLSLEPEAKTGSVAKKAPVSNCNSTFLIRCPCSWSVGKCRKEPRTSLEFIPQSNQIKEWRPLRRTYPSTLWKDHSSICAGSWLGAKLIDLRHHLWAHNVFEESRIDVFVETWSLTRMSQEVSKWLVSGL